MGTCCSTNPQDPEASPKTPEAPTATAEDSARVTLGNNIFLEVSTQNRESIGASEPSSIKKEVIPLNNFDDVVHTAADIEEALAETPRSHVLHMKDIRLASQNSSPCTTNSPEHVTQWLDEQLSVRIKRKRRKPPTPFTLDTSANPSQVPSEAASPKAQDGEVEERPSCLADIVFADATPMAQCTPVATPETSVSQV